MPGHTRQTLCTHVVFFTAVQPQSLVSFARRTGLSPSQATWTIFIDVAAQVVCKALRAPDPTMAYVYQEADRVGQLSMERCEAMQVVPGAAFSQLKNGCSVVNA